MPSLVQKDQNVKRFTDRRTDDGQQAIRNFSSGELKPSFFRAVFSWDTYIDGYVFYCMLCVHIISLYYHSNTLLFSKFYRRLFNTPYSFAVEQNAIMYIYMFPSDFMTPREKKKKICNFYAFEIMHILVLQLKA